MKKDVDYELRVTLTQENEIKTKSGVFNTSECSVTRIPVSILRGADKTICYAQPFSVILGGYRVDKTYHKTFFSKKVKEILEESNFVCFSFGKGVTEIEIMSDEKDFVKWFEKIRIEIEKWFLLYIEDVFLNNLRIFKGISPPVFHGDIYDGDCDSFTENTQGILKELVNTDFGIKCQFISHVSSLELPSI